MPTDPFILGFLLVCLVVAGVLGLAELGARIRHSRSPRTLLPRPRRARGRLPRA